jgi:hypothetical protein
MRLGEGFAEEPRSSLQKQSALVLQKRNGQQRGRHLFESYNEWRDRSFSERRPDCCR